MIGVQGVHHSADLRAQGLSTREVQRKVRTGQLVRVRRGVYCDGAVWDKSADSTRQRHAIEVHAAILAIGRRGWASGYSAALLMDLPVPHGQPDVVEISLPQRPLGRRSYPGLRVRTASIADGDLFVVRQLPVTSPARTSLDVSRTHGLAAGLVLADAATRRNLVRPEELDVVAARMNGWPNSSHAHLVAQHASGARESPGESISFAAFVAGGIPLPECNAWVTEDHFGGVRSDFLWRRYRLVGETDGYVKYVDPLWSPRDRVLLDEKKRQLHIEEAGFVVVRWTPAEIIQQPRVVLERIVRHSHVAARMFGVAPMTLP